MGKVQRFKRLLSVILSAAMLVCGTLTGYVPASAASRPQVTLTVIGDSGDHSSNASAHTGYVYWAKDIDLGVSVTALTDKHIAVNVAEQIRSALAASGITYTEDSNLYMTSMTKDGVTLDSGSYTGGYWSVFVAYSDGTGSADGWGSYEGAAILKPGCRLIYYWSDTPGTDCRLRDGGNGIKLLAYDTDAVTGVALYEGAGQDQALTEKTLEAGSTMDVAAALTVPAGSQVNKTLTWTSDRESVASVAAAANGARVTAISAGSAIIKASMVNTLGETVESSFTVNVTADGTTITGMSFDPAIAGPMQPGDSLLLTEEVTPVFTPALSQGEQAPALSFVSQNPAVAVVDRTSGEVTAVAPGTAVITASFVNNQGQTVSGQITVTVSEVALAGITMDRAFVTMDAGKTETLRLNLAPANTTLIPEISWETSDPSVLAVVGNGTSAEVTGIKGGTAVVTARAGELTATSEITVRNAAETPMLADLVFASSNAATGVIYAYASPIDPETKEATVLVPENTNALYLKPVLAEGVSAAVKATYDNYNRTKVIERDLPAGVLTACTSTNRILQTDQEARDVTITVAGAARTETYLFHILRESLVKSLSAVDNKGGRIEISPVFAPATRAYTASVPASVTAATVTFEANHADSTTLTVNGAPAANGSATVELAQVVNKITVAAGNEGTHAAEYTLTITKETAYGVTFATTPADAIVALYNSNNVRVLPENGVFDVLPGTYHYVVSKTGYQAQTGQVEVAGAPVIVEAALTAAPASTLTNLDSEWSSFRKDNDNQGVVNSATPILKEATGLKWENKAGDGYSSGAVSSPILVGDYVYCVAGNSILKLSKETGEVVASGTMVATSSFAINPPSYANGMVFVGLSGGRIQAFDAVTLKSLWLYTDPLGGQPNCSLKYDSGYVYTGFWNSETKLANFVCISVTDEDPANETEAKQASWIHTGNGFYWADSFVRGDYVMVGSDDGANGATGNASLWVLNKTTGIPVQKIDGHYGDIRSGISYYNGRIYFTSKGGMLYSYNLTSEGLVDTEHPIEPLKVGNMSTSTPLLYGGRCYVGTTFGENFSGTYGIMVIDVNAATGAMTLAYGVPTDAYPQTSGVLTTAYAGGEDGYNYVYFTTNGPQGNLWVVKDRAGMTEPSEDSGILFTPNHVQYCICSVVVDSDGVIYFKNDSGYMMAVEKMSAYIEDVQVTTEGALLDEGEAFAGKVAEHKIAYIKGTESLHLEISAPDNMIVSINGVKGTIQDVAIEGLSEITVTVSDGENEKTYTFALVAKSQDASLSEFIVTNNNAYSGGMKIYPGFDPEVTDYNCGYNMDKTFLSIWPAVNEPHATYVVTAVSGVKDKAAGEEIKVTATSGVHKRYAIYFADSTYQTPAVVAVTVTSEDGQATKTYTMTLSIDKVKPVLTLGAEDAERTAGKEVTFTASASEDGYVFFTTEEDTAANIIKNGKGVPVVQGENTITFTDVPAEADTLWIAMADYASNTSAVKMLGTDPFDTTPAKEVMAIIDELPDAEELTLESFEAAKEEIEAARAAYEEIGEDQKEFVENLDKLTALEEKITALEEEKAAIEREKEEAERKEQEARDAFFAQFGDLRDGMWYSDNCWYVYKNGIMTGMNDTTFGTTRNLARAQFATILYRLSGAPEMTYEKIFPDVKEGQWFTDAVIWAAKEGVVTGYNDGTFGPAKNITREQMAVMLYRYAKKNGVDVSAQADFTAFMDGKKVSSFAKTEMSWAVASGIITGKERADGKYLEPQGLASRAECATIITRYMKLAE